MAPRASALRLGFFGNFYPSVARLGPTSTGLVLLLGRSPGIDRITVFGGRGAQTPPFGPVHKIEIVPSWDVDRPLDLLRTLLSMFRRRREFDAFLFNVYLTGFGRSWTSNGVGLLLPTVLAVLTRRPVAVYLHNVVEAQRPEALGYRVGTGTIWVARGLTALLSRATQLFVPLPSQQQALATAGTGSAESLALPYVEGVLGAYQWLAHPPAGTSPPAKRAPGILLFGAWGPQKDLAGALDALGPILESGAPVRVTVAGSVNGNFVDYASEFEALRARWEPRGLLFRLGVAESELLGLLADSEILLLPYRAAGGYSGVMNVGATFGLSIIAYDVPELREFDRILAAGTTFVNGADPRSLREGIEAVLRRRANPTTISATDLLQRLDLAQSAVDQLSARLAG